MRFAANDASAFGGAAFARLALRWVEKGEIVVVRKLLVWVDIPEREQRHSEETVDAPFLHFAVRFAGMVDKTA